MTTDSTQPQPEMGPTPANGQPQGTGHRRRRRRRKNKSAHAAGAAPQQQQGQPQQQGQQQPGQAAPQQSAPQQQQGQQGPRQQQQPRHKQQQQGQGQGQGQGGRKKKKFFQKGDRPPQPERGNSLNPPQGKRKQRQRGPREFVGPMDHSYRVANGNVAEGPASTIPVNGNGHGSYFPELYSNAPAPAIREDAPTRIFCFIEDLFFLAKIQETARKLGVKVEFVKGDKDVVTRLLDAPDEERARLLVFDLNNANAKPLTLIPKFKAKFKKSTSVIGFLSHLQGDLKAKAVEAGCDTVMPRSAFSQGLPNLLRRYGMEEEEEYVPQPM